ncbi:tRNA (guanosine(46)-N7)-methyltransferase TrmB [Kocuria oceani]|uniref:tRNA (guanine-N(7)-)-methyltransferase n=1 Tax=Kocuria oceani TaxID=988827 RepID=A0ABV9TID5_9MICC|nr:tRNA (guanosine(46)-N7)-methyltransferase TrmB [Kocuria oceani]
MTEHTPSPADTPAEPPADEAADVSAEEGAAGSAETTSEDPAEEAAGEHAGGTGQGPVPAAFHRRPYSFVRRGDRLTARRQKAWDDWAPTRVLDVPRVRTDTSVHPDHEFDAAAAFGREAPLVVEVGSGLGEAVVHAAAQDPARDYLAVEVYKPGIADLLLKAGQAGVDNVRVVQANAPEVLEHMLAPASVDELWVFFPDPWHKTRHHKRRLVSPAFADLAARVLVPGGLWRLATDWQEYALVMREVLDAAPRFENLHPGPLADDEHPDVGWAPRWEGRVLTSFERKAQEAGRVPRDLTYRRLP